MTENETEIFLERAVHDLRASGRAISLAVEMGFGSVPESVEGMNRILEGMASYVAVSRHSTYARDEVSCEYALIAASQTLRKAIDESQAKIESGNLPRVLGDDQRIAELFAIVISNGIVYRGDEPPRILLNAADDGDFWLFSATDNGIGVDERHREKIFLPFLRLHGPARPGVGLGLTIARKIVQGHGGSIEFSGDKTVSFRLPKA